MILSVPFPLNIASLFTRRHPLSEPEDASVMVLVVPEATFILVRLLFWILMAALQKLGVVLVNVRPLRIIVQLYALFKKNSPSVELPFRMYVISVEVLFEVIDT